jgi:hypothetical protein
MSENARTKNSTTARSKSHMPAGSLLFEKVVPVLLVLLGLLMLILVLFAAGVLLGIVRF